MNLETIDLEKYKDERDGWYEVDLYPERTFKRTVDISLFPRECFGNYQYMYLFEYCDTRDIRIRLHTSYNLFPIASLVGHTIILQSPLTKEDMVHRVYKSKVSKMCFDWRYSWRKYGVKEWFARNPTRDTRWMNDLPDAGFVWAKSPEERGRPKPTHVMPTRGHNGLFGHYELVVLFEQFKDRTIFIEKEAFDIFTREKDHFPSDSLWIEYSKQTSEYVDNLIAINENSGIPTCVASKGPHDRCPQGWENEGVQDKLILNYKGNKHLLTYQMLCSLYNNVKFASVAGAASLFCVCPFVNSRILIDSGHNVTLQAGYLKSMFNRDIFNQHSYCLPYEIHSGREENGLMDSSGWYPSSMSPIEPLKLEFVKMIAKDITNEKTDIKFNLIREGEANSTKTSGGTNEHPIPDIPPFHEAGD